MSDADDFSDTTNQSCEYFDTGYRNPSPPSDGQPYVKILEQPQSRGFRFRYECEGKSHGGLQSERSRREAKRYPSVQICNYRGAAKVTVSLVTDEKVPRPHANLLIGKNCPGGICTIQVKGDHQDPVISFPNLSIRHVTKKAVPAILMDRLREAKCADKMMMNGCLGQSIDQVQLTPAEEQQLKRQAESQAKDMALNVVRLSFRAYLLDENMVCTKVLPAVVSNPIYDSKAPSAAVLRITRMDKVGGLCTGQEEVFMLCDKVQKDDILVRFYEEDDDGNLKWEDYGVFNSHDVHRQYAIVFRTPAYARTDIDAPVKVKVQLKRMSDEETSDPKTFMYYPQQTDSEEIRRKKQKRLSNLDEQSIFLMAGPSSGQSRNYLQALQNTQSQHVVFTNNARTSVPAVADATTNFSGQHQLVYASNLSTTIRGRLEEDSVPLNDLVGRSLPPAEVSGMPHKLESARDPSSKIATGAAQQLQMEKKQEMGKQSQERETQTNELGPPEQTELAVALIRLFERTSCAIQNYAQTNDARHLLMPTRYLIGKCNADGDNAVHLSVIHSQPAALSNILSVLSSLPSVDAVNELNNLFQTPLQLAVVTGQTEVVRLLLAHGAEPRVVFYKQRGDTVLHITARNGDATCMELLLRHWNIDRKPKDAKTWYPGIDYLNFEGFSALHLAARGGHVGCVRALTEVGHADINLRDGCCGRTALHHAVISNNLAVVAHLILECAADVDIPDDSGNMPLHHASSSNLVEMAALLVAAGANPNAENCDYCNSESDSDDGDNQVSTGIGSEKQQQDESHRNERVGMTPRDLAELCHQTEMMRILDGESYTSINNEKIGSLPTMNVGATQDVHLKSYIDSGIESILVPFNPYGPTPVRGNMNVLDALTRAQLSKLLDPVKPNSDWRELAKQLKLQTSLRGFEVQKSPTKALLDSYEVADGTVEELLKCLHAISRQDAIDLIKQSVPDV